MKVALSFSAMILSSVMTVSSFFVSCATTQVEQKPLTPVVYVTDTKKVNLLTADLISRNLDEVQLFEGSFGEQNFTMPLYIQADKSGINISMLSDMGTNIGELSYSNNSAEFSSGVFPQELKAEYVIWDIQLSYYDAQSLSGNLSDGKLTLTVEYDGIVETRKIMDGKILIEEVILSENSTVIKNYLRGYEFCLTGVGNE